MNPNNQTPPSNFVNNDGEDTEEAVDMISPAAECPDEDVESAATARGMRVASVVCVSLL